MLPFLKNRKPVVSYIIKKENEYDKMKAHNELGPEEMMVRRSPEQDNMDAMKQCASDLMQAIDSKDSSQMAASLKKMIKMVVAEVEASEDDD